LQRCKIIKRVNGTLSLGIVTPALNRLKEHFDFSAIDYVYAYGNSRGDREMLELADETYYRYF